MATTVRTERRKRGFFGWVFLLLFLGFNALMLVAMLVGLGSSGEQLAQPMTDAERAGATVGTALGVSFILFIWAAGALILGLLVLLTPGRKVVTETVEGRS